MSEPIEGVVLDTVWMIVKTDPACVIYGRPAKSASEAWQKACNEMGEPPVSKAYLMGQGYRAARVAIVLPGSKAATTPAIKVGVVYVFTKSGNKVRVIAPTEGTNQWVVERIDGKSKGKRMIATGSGLAVPTEEEDNGPDHRNP